jgi:F-type H+-transporting ATPase subunit delta
MVTIPASTGVMGILADHAPTIAQLKPGIVQVHTSDINDITHKYFISGGFAFIKDDSSAAIAAVEAIKVDDLDLAAAKKGIEDAISAGQRTQDEKQKAEAQIQQEVYEAIVNALEGR